VIVDAEEIDLLTGSLRSVFAEAGADVPRHLRELGWDDVAAADPGAATTLLFTEKGRALSSAALLDDAVLPLLRAGLPVSLLGGTDLVCYPYPGSGAGSAAGPSSTPLAVTGILLRQPGPDERLVIPVADSDGVSLAVAPASAFTVTPVPSLDHEAGWYAVAGPTPATRYDGDAWADVVAAAHRALAAEITGAAERALELAVEHTSSRRQFNAPIAAFQAVRHRLADGYVAIAAARALLAASFGDVSGSATVAAAAAKARAGRAHQTVSATAVQVCGAMGATLEHPLHRYVNRGAVLDGLLGSSAELTAELGSMIRATVTSGGEIPLLVEVC
jgi:Acyl-CoA dehydrogenase, C-terminal domain